MSGPTIVEIPQTGTGSTGLTKSRYAQHDALYGRAIKNTLVDSNNSNNANTVPSTYAFKQLDDKKLDLAGGTMTGNLTLTDADIEARDITASGTLSANAISITANSTITNKLTMGSMKVNNNATIDGSLTVGTNLTVLGSTTTVNSNVVTIDDPVIQVGTDTDEDTTLDRGVTFMYHDGTEPQKGFFGWDRHYNAFVMRPVAVESPDNLIGGSVGNIRANEFKGATLDLTGTVEVLGVSTFKEDVKIENGGDLTVTGGGFSVDGAVDLSAVGKTTTVKGSLQVDEATTVSNDFTATGTVDLAASELETTVKGSLKVDEGATVNNAFVATGTVQLAASEVETTIKGTLQVDEAATVSNDFTATGTIDLSEAGKTTTVKGSLQVDETTTVSNDFTATGAVDLSAPTKQTTVKGTLQVDKAATVSNDLTATGTVDLSAVGKTTTVKGSLQVDEATTVSNDFTATGVVDLSAVGKQTTVKGSLQVDEATTVSNDLTATGVVDLSAPTKQTTVKGSLQVDEATTVSNDLTATGVVDLSAPTKQTTVKGSLQVDEAATFDSNVSVGTSGKVSFGSAHRQQIDLYSTTYGIGTQTNTLYARTPGGFKWYRGGSHDTSSAGTGGTKAMELDNNSNLTVTGNMTSLSDMRVKRNVETLESASDKLSQVRGVRFEKRDEPDGIKHIGVIAQEIETVFPEVVLTDPTTGIKSVAYANMVGALIQAHNEMRETIRAMQEKLDRLCP